MFEERRKIRNLWRRYAMFFGLNMRKTSRTDSLDESYDSRSRVKRTRPPSLYRVGDSDFVHSTKSHVTRFPERSSFRVKPGRLLKADPDSRRGLSAADKLFFLAVIILIFAGGNCLLGDCATFDLVIRSLLKPIAGGQL